MHLSRVNDMAKAGLVVGAGIAGIQAALDLADQGFEVYLVEKNPSIGGRMSQLDKTFPTMDCSACILTPKMVDVGRHPNIRLLAYSELEEISRKGKNFKVKILQKPRYIDETKCTGCGICAQHCPVEVPNEFDEGLGVRKAVYVPFPQAVPLIYTIDKDHCLECGLCEKVCGAEAIDLQQEPKEIDVEVGAIIVATGYNLFDAREKEEYGYGVYSNVITGLMLERLLSASGPTGGHVIRPSDGKIPRKVAFVQCVGSRDEKIGNLYCSRVCCMYATKEAQLIKEHVPEAEVTVFYIDIRAFGKGFEEFYRRAEKEFNIRYVKGRVAEIQESPVNKNLFIRAENVESGEPIEEGFDMVVLSTGIVPAATNEMENIVPIPIGEDGFFVAANPKLDPVTTALNGVFTAGVAESPKDIPDSVAQASAAAMKASIFLKGEGMGEDVSRKS
ncbi:CoB--CoM heterodisulfide reductase iron-sulfur subunit A family protein [Candidatus Bathyarchaeota archaeon]|nr:CoB--CoM heterodisulfide reductase iron-sulfur subunit A family protein [Candidatus Bathyarchaeota archaeon]